MWEVALATPPLQDVLARAGTFEQRIMRVAGVPESELARLLRELDFSLDPLEVTTCLRRGELEIATVFEPAAADDVRRSRGCRGGSLRRAGLLARRVDDRRDRGGVAPRAACADRRRRRVVHGRADGGPPDRPRGLVRLRARAAWSCTRTRRRSSMPGSTRTSSPASGPSHPRSPSLWPRAPPHGSPPTSGSASPASPVRAEGRPRSRSAWSASASSGPARSPARTYAPAPGRPGRGPRPHHDRGHASAPAGVARAAGPPRRDRSVRAHPSCASSSRSSCPGARSTPSPRFRDAAADPDVWRPVPTESLHLTLAFLGRRPASTSPRSTASCAPPPARRRALRWPGRCSSRPAARACCAPPSRTSTTRSPTSRRA